jgi:hypothetical protein
MRLDGIILLPVFTFLSLGNQGSELDSSWAVSYVSTELISILSEIVPP